jgi:hypothetical protein
MALIGWDHCDTVEESTLTVIPVTVHPWQSPPRTAGLTIIGVVSVIGP